jgi:hypothetical protein
VSPADATSLTVIGASLFSGLAPLFSGASKAIWGKVVWRIEMGKFMKSEL